jgi:hypothetical protein
MKENDNKFDNKWFVICPYSIAYRYDLVSACLYGVIWSLSQLEQGYCCASETTLGFKLGGFKRQTISKKIKVLEKAKLIKIITRKRYKEGGVTLRIICNSTQLTLLDIEVKAELERISQELELEYQEESSCQIIEQA